MQEQFYESPLAIGTATLALGLATGLAVPATRREAELVDDARDRLSIAPPAQPLVDQIPLSRDAITTQTRRIMALVAFTPREVDRFVASLMGDSPRIDFTSLPFASDHDFIRAIYVAHRGLSSGPPFRFRPRPCDRPDCRNPFCEVCHAAIGSYRVPRGVLERVQRPRGLTGRIAKL